MNHKMEYQKPEIISIALECEAMIAGSNSLSSDSDKDFGGIAPVNGMSSSVKVNLSGED